MRDYSGSVSLVRVSICEMPFIAAIWTGSLKDKTSKMLDAIKTITEIQGSIRTKVAMLLGFTSGQSLLMIVSEKLVKEVDRIVIHETLVVRSHKTSPRFTRIPIGKMMFLSSQRMRRTGF